MGSQGDCTGGRDEWGGHGPGAGAGWEGAAAYGGPGAGAGICLALIRRPHRYHRSAGCYG